MNVVDAPARTVPPFHASMLIAGESMVRGERLEVYNPAHPDELVGTIVRGNKVLDGSLDEVQATYGHDTVRVRVAGGAAALSRMKDQGRIESMNDAACASNVAGSINPLKADARNLSFVPLFYRGLFARRRGLARL